MKTVKNTKCEKGEKMVQRKNEEIEKRKRKK